MATAPLSVSGPRADGSDSLPAPGLTPARGSCGTSVAPAPRGPSRSCPRRSRQLSPRQDAHARPCVVDSGAGARGRRLCPAAGEGPRSPGAGRPAAQRGSASARSVLRPSRPRPASLGAAGRPAWFRHGGPPRPGPGSSRRCQVCAENVAAAAGFPPSDSPG